MGRTDVQDHGMRSSGVQITMQMMSRTADTNSQMVILRNLACETQSNNVEREDSMHKCGCSCTSLEGAWSGARLHPRSCKFRRELLGAHTAETKGNNYKDAGVKMEFGRGSTEFKGE